jgi:methylated-DNA-[protein]-cysteine S-methyltransferase
MESAVMFCDYINTPLGIMEIKASDNGIVQVIFCGDEQSEVNPNSLTERCKIQLTEYFYQKRISFELPLEPNGTRFQNKVWLELAKIPFGHTASYLDIAKAVDNPKGSQAVGGANGRNPLTLIVPCHRVVGSNGTLTGYAGGIERKLWLLNHEGIMIKNDKVK